MSWACVAAMLQLHRSKLSRFNRDVRIRCMQEATTLGHAHSRDGDMPCPPEVERHPLTALQGQTCLYSRSVNWINVAADQTVLGIQHSPEGQAGKALSCAVRSASDPATDIARSTGARRRPCIWRTGVQANHCPWIYSQATWQCRMCHRWLGNDACPRHGPPAIATEAAPPCMSHE